MNRIAHFLHLALTHDAEQIEQVRGSVQETDLAALADAYWSLQQWGQKAALLQLVQNHIHPDTRPIMLDILQAPDDELAGRFETTKAIALCHLEGDLGLFTGYQDNPGLLDEALRRHKPVEPPAEPVQDPTAEMLTLVRRGAKRLNLLFYLGVLAGILMGPAVLVASLIPAAAGRLSGDAGNSVVMTVFGGLMTILCAVVLVEQWRKARRDARLLAVLENDPHRLAWVYKEIRVGRLQRRPGAARQPVARFAHVVFHLLDGSRSLIWLPEPDADRLVELVAGAFADLSIGYSTDLEQAYQDGCRLARLKENPERTDGVKQTTSGLRYR